MGTRQAQYPYDPDYAVPPGATLLDKIEELEIGKGELALRLGLSAKHVSRIIHGHEPITPETAIGLERVTGVPASFWNAREAIYRERLARIRDGENLQRDLEWLRSIPTGELCKRGFVTTTRRDVGLLRETLAFFGVSGTAAWQNYWDEFIAKVGARESPSFEARREALATWLRLGELQARDIECQPFDKSGFHGALADIRKLTRKDPKVFVPKTRRLCGDTGVALALVPELKNVPWHGASWWITPQKAIIELNLRGRKEDHFWFSFFHEAGHILRDSKKAVFINDGSKGDENEGKADAFAADFLIPADRLPEVLQVRTQEQILGLADSLGISPGIVVGRLQRETKKWNWFNNLRRTFVWTAQ